MASTPEEQKKRLKEIGGYLNHFKELQEKKGFTDTIFREDAAELINAVYFRYADEVVRPALIDNTRIQVYKIASNTELAVLLVSPIVHSDYKKQRLLNAQLAFFVAASLLFEWEEISMDKVNTLLDEDSKLKSFLLEHFNWLFLLDPKHYYPIFSNSQVWRLFHYVILDRIGKVK